MRVDLESRVTFAPHSAAICPAQRTDAYSQDDDIAAQGRATRASKPGNKLAQASRMRRGRFFVRLVLCLAVTVFLTTLAASCGGSPTAPDSSPSAAPAQDPATATSLTYSADVQPLLNNDCVPCHGGSSTNGGVNLTSYTNVMRTVTPGSSRSVLVTVSQPGGLMYSEWRGSASAKAETIRRWVVDFNAAQ